MRKLLALLVLLATPALADTTIEGPITFGPGVTVAGARVTTDMVTPMNYGCVGDGVADDTTCVQAAMTAQTGKTLWTGPHKYKITSTLTFDGRLIGEHSRTTGGFVQGVTNIDLLTHTGSNLEVAGVMFDIGAVGTSTSGRAINDSVSSQDTYIHDNYFFKPFIGVDVGLGINQAVTHNNFDQIVANGRGIRVGHASTSGNTIDPQITWNTFNVVGGSIGNLAMLFEDAGGAQVANNTTGISSTTIKPGQNQVVQWGFFQGEMGDTAANSSLIIDTAHSSAVIKGLDFDQVWASASTVGNGVHILNTAGGTVSGLTFRGLRAFGNSLDGVDVGSGSQTITDIKIIGGSICSNSVATANASNGISINSVNVTRGVISGNTIGNGCNGVAGGTQGTGVAFLAAAPDWVVSNNDLTTSTGAAGGFGGSTGARTRVTDNLGYNPFGVFDITVTASPFTWTAGPSPETVYITAGATVTATVGGKDACSASPCSLYLGPHEAAIVSYVGAPTMERSVH